MLVLPKWGASRGISPPHARLPHSGPNANVRLGGTPTFPAAQVFERLRRLVEGPEPQLRRRSKGAGVGTTWFGGPCWVRLRQSSSKARGGKKGPSEASRAPGCDARAPHWPWIANQGERIGDSKGDVFEPERGTLLPTV